MALIHGMSFLLIVYNPRDNGIAIFHREAEKIHGIISDHPPVTIHIYGNFTIHHQGVVSLFKHNQ